MASVSSLGVGSGLDLGSIVTSLVEAERAPTDNRLNFQEQTLSTELSAFGVLRSSLSLFQGSLTSLKYSTSYNEKSASLSDSSVFSTSLLSSAAVGSYDVEVTSLARAHTLATNEATAFNSVSDTVGTGTLTLQFGSTTTGPYSFTPDITKATQTITVSEANNNTTLSGLRDYINDNDYGVQAAIVNDGNGYRLTLTSENSGANNSMEITVTDDGDADNNDNSGLSQLAFNALAQTSVVQTAAAQDAVLKINGLDITRETNTVTGAIDGVTLNLLKADVGNTVNINVAENNDGVKEGVQGFVDSYNSLVGAINSLTSYDPETTEAGVLIGDFTVRSISSQLRSIIGNQVPELSGNISSLIDIGIKTNSDGTLNLDSAKLNSALSNYPDEVEALFALQGRPTDADLSYSTASDDTVAGDYSVNITALATKGVYNGATVNSLVIDANNDNFTISLDGTVSNSISLTQATYADGDALASHIQAQINDDVNLKAAGSSVSVVFDSLNNEFDITSAKYGSASKVEFTTIDTNTANDLGFSTGIGTNGIDVAGTINGFTATGNGQTLTSAYGDSKGLALSIISGSTGSRGSVSFSRGIATSMDTLLSNFLNANGFIDSREDGLKNSLDNIQDERKTLELRMVSLEARLVAQFSALDTLVSRFKTTSSFLTDQLSNLPGSDTMLNK